MTPYAPMLLGTAPKPFAAPGWDAEIKWDGYRAIVEIAPAGVRIWSKQGREMTTLFPEMQALREVVPHAAVLDGEICALDDAGYPQFHRIRSREVHRTLIAFDVLRVGRRDITGQTLDERRAQLATLIPEDHPLIFRSRPVADIVTLFARCEAARVEGIVVKRKDAPYVAGRRTAHGLKVKTTEGKRITRERMRFGFRGTPDARLSDPQGTPREIRSLALPDGLTRVPNGSSMDL